LTRSFSDRPVSYVTFATLALRLPSNYLVTRFVQALAIWPVYDLEILSFLVRL
jgi:hypothetical protein